MSTNEARIPHDAVEDVPNLNSTQRPPTEEEDDGEAECTDNTPITIDGVEDITLRAAGADVNSVISPDRDDEDEDELLSGGSLGTPIQGITSGVYIGSDDEGLSGAGTGELGTGPLSTSDPDSRYWLRLEARVLLQPLGEENNWSEVGEGRVELNGLNVRIVASSYVSKQPKGSKKNKKKSKKSKKSSKSSGGDVEGGLGNGDVTTEDSSVIIPPRIEVRNHIIMEDLLEQDTPLVGENSCIVWNSLDQQMSLCLMFGNPHSFSAVWSAIHAAQNQPCPTPFHYNVLLAGMMMDTPPSLKPSSSTSPALKPRPLFGDFVNIPKYVKPRPLVEDGCNSDDGGDDQPLHELETTATFTTNMSKLTDAQLLAMAFNIRWLCVEHLFAEEDVDESLQLCAQNDSGSKAGVDVEGVVDPNADNIGSAQKQHDDSTTAKIVEQFATAPITQRRMPLQQIERHVLSSLIIKFRLLERGPLRPLFFPKSLTTATPTAAPASLVYTRSIEGIEGGNHSESLRVAIQKLWHPRITIGILALSNVDLLEYIVVGKLPPSVTHAEGECGRISNTVSEGIFEHLCGCLRQILGHGGMGGVAPSSPTSTFSPMTALLGGNLATSNTTTSPFSTASLQKWSVPESLRHMEAIINRQRDSSSNTDNSGNSGDEDDSSQGSAEGGNKVGSSPTRPSPQKLSLEEVINGSLRLLHLRNDVLPHGGDIPLLNNVFGRIQQQSRDHQQPPTSFSWSSQSPKKQQAQEAAINISPPCVHMVPIQGSSSSSGGGERQFHLSPTHSGYEGGDDYAVLPIPVLPRAVDEEMVNILESINHRLLNETLCGMLVDDKMLLVAVQQLFMYPTPQQQNHQNGLGDATVGAASGFFDVPTANQSDLALDKCRVLFTDLPDVVQSAAAVIHRNVTTNNNEDNMVIATSSVEAAANRKAAHEAYDALSQPHTTTTSSTPSAAEDAAASPSLVLAPAEHVRDHLRFIISTLHLSSVAFSKDLITAVSIKLYSPGLLDAISFVCEHYVCPLVGERVTTNQRPLVPVDQIEAAWEIVLELRLLLQFTITKMNEKGEEGTLSEIIRTPVTANPQNFHGLLQFLVGDMCGWYDDGLSKLALSRGGEEVTKSLHGTAPVKFMNGSNSRSASISRFSSVGIVAEPISPPTKKVMSNSSSLRLHRSSYFSSSKGGHRAASHFKGIGNNEKLLYHFMGLHDDEGVSCDRFGDITLNGKRDLFHRYMIIHCLSPLVTRTSPSSSLSSATHDGNEGSNTSSTNNSAFSWLPPTMNTSALSATLSGAMIRVFEYMMITCCIDNKELLLGRVILHPRSIVLPWVRGAADASLLIETYKQRHNSNNTTSSNQHQPSGVVVDADVMIQVTQFIRSVFNFIAPWYSPTGKTSHLSALFVTGEGLPPPEDYPHVVDTNPLMNEAVVGTALDMSSTSDPSSPIAKSSSSTSSTKAKKKPLHKPLSKPLRVALKWRDYVLSRIVYGCTPSVYWRHFVNLCATTSSSALHIPELHAPHMLPMHTSLSPSASCILAPFVALYHLRGGPTGSKVTLFHGTLRSLFALLESDLPPTSLLKAVSGRIPSQDIFPSQSDDLDDMIPDSVTTGCGSYQVLTAGPSRMFESMKRAEELEDQKQRLKETKAPLHTLSAVTSDTDSQPGDGQPSGGGAHSKQHPYEQLLLQLEGSTPTDLVKLSLLPSFPMNGAPSSTILRGTRDEEGGVLDSLLLGAGGASPTFSCGAFSSENDMESDPNVLLHTLMHRVLTRMDTLSVFRTALLRLYPSNPLLPDPLLNKPGMFPIHKRSHHANTRVEVPILGERAGGILSASDVHASRYAPTVLLSLPLGVGSTWATAESLRERAALLRQFTVAENCGFEEEDGGIEDDGAVSECVVLAGEISKFRHDSMSTMASRAKDQKQLVLEGGGTGSRKGSMSYIAGGGVGMAGNASTRSGSINIKRSSTIHSDGSVSPTNSSNQLLLGHDGSPVRTSPSRSGNGVTPPRAVDELPADLPSPVSGKVRGSPISRRGGGASPNNRSLIRTSGGTALPLMPGTSSPSQHQQPGSDSSTASANNNSANSIYSGSDAIGNPTAKEMENFAAFPKRLRCMLGRLSPAPGSNNSSGDIMPPTQSPPRSSSPGLPHQHPAAPPVRGGNNSRSRGPSSEATSPMHSQSPTNAMIPSMSIPPAITAAATSSSSSRVSSITGQVIPVITADEEAATEGVDYGSPSRELNPPTTLNSTAASPEKASNAGNNARTASPAPDPTEQPSSETVARPPSSEPTAMFARRRASLEIANEMVMAGSISSSGNGPLVPTKPKSKPQSAASVSSSSARPVGRDIEGPRAESAPSPSQVPPGTSSPRTGRNGSTTSTPTTTTSSIGSGVRPVSPNRGLNSNGSNQPSTSSAPRATSPVSVPSRTSGARASRTNSGSSRQ